MSWPLVGADARPLWWREDLRAYVNHKGELLLYDNNDNILKDNNGFVVHSVISNVIAGMKITLIYLADNTTLIPVTMKLINKDTKEVEYYDMNGNVVDINEITEPVFDTDDLKANWPEEFLTWWEQVKAFFAAIGEFFSNYGKWFIIGVGVIIVLILLAVLLPPVKLAFSVVFGAITFVFNLLIKIITAPLKLFSSKKRGYYGKKKKYK